MAEEAKVSNGSPAQCFENGARTQSVLFHASSTISAMLDRVHAVPERLTLPSGTVYTAQNDEILKIEKETVLDNMKHAVEILESGNCGVGKEKIDKIKSALDTVREKLNVGDYGNAWTKLDQVRAQLVHPSRYFK